MKLMHLSDLHLGRVLNGFDLIKDQAYILDRICEEIEKEKPLFLLICGDVFDKYIPAVEAVELLSDFLGKISSFDNMRTIIISGNHDQAERLNYLSSFLVKNRIYLSTNIEQALKPFIFDEEKIAFCAIPYISTAKIQNHFKEDIDCVAGYERIIDNFMELVPSNYNKVALVHDFMLGGVASDSERILSLGALEQLPIQIFSDFDYIALGHLHKMQKIAFNAYYSGSPLKYGEKEYRNKNGYLLIDTSDFSVEVKEVRPLRDMAYIEDYFENLPNYINEKDKYVYIELLDTEKIMDMVQRVRELFPYCLGVSKKSTFVDGTNNRKAKTNLNDIEIFNQFYEYVSGTKPSKEYQELFHFTLQEVEAE